MRFVILDSTEVEVETHELHDLGVDVTCCASTKPDGAPPSDDTTPTLKRQLRTLVPL